MTATKFAPYAKQQKKEAFELFILAGDDAFNAERKELLRIAIQADNDFQPIVLNTESLTNIKNLKLVKESNKQTAKSIRIYRAGEMSKAAENALLLNIAEQTLADTVSLWGEDYQLEANLSDFILRTRNGQSALKETVALEESKNPPQVKQDDKIHIKSKHFANWLNRPLALHDQSNEIYQYVGNVWQKMPANELSRLVRAFYEAHNLSYSGTAIKSLIETLTVQLEPLGEQVGGYIPFANGLLARDTGEFVPHDQNHYLVSVIPHNYDTHAKGTPNFDKWLKFVANGKKDKAEAILAGLYMILTNRYNWQLFLEITGEGGSGKSIFAHIATLLAGEQNTVSSGLEEMENSKERGKLVDKTLIICPDQPKYNGSGSTLKAITGGDLIGINPKYKDPFDTVIKAVVILINNNPMRFTERNGGIERRRVIFDFDQVVPFDERDFNLPDKITLEIGGIINRLLSAFPDENEARRTLYRQMASEEALEVKEESDPLVVFCGYFYTSDNPDGLFMGNARMPFSNAKTHLYPAYLAFASANNIKYELSLPAFSKALRQGMKQTGNAEQVRKKKTSGGYRTNIRYRNFEEFFDEIKLN